MITTAAVGPAHKDAEFRLVLQATVSEQPVTWSFAATPPTALSWLSLSTDGILSGTPSTIVAGEQLTVRATDGGGRSTDKTFTVVVDFCADGDETPCTFVSGDACVLGTAVCQDGQPGACSGSVSTAAAACGVVQGQSGSTCGACDVKSDSCDAGATCRCGSGQPCSGTHTTSATCTDVRSCPTGRVLSGSRCICDTGLTDCGGTCVNLQTNKYDCGYCGDVCPADAGEVASCSSGTCTTRCASGHETCNGLCVPIGDCSTCFVAGTPVTLADGSTKAIDEIVAGDRVLAMDVETRTLRAAVVSHPIFHETAPALLRVNGRITTTPEHPFFVAGEWRHAIELHIGDVLVTAEPSGAVGTEVVTQLELLEGGVPVYNLEVPGPHDYFAGGVLVHNLKQIP